MKKTFQFRIYTSKDVVQKTIKIIDFCRILYNTALEQRILAWKYHKKSISKFNQTKQLPELKNIFPEFSEIPSQSAQEVIERLDNAFQGFFRRIKAGEKAGFPRYKGFNRYDSFTLKQSGWKLEGKYLIIKKIGKFKIKLHRPIEGTIKTITIRKTQTGKWYACFSCDNVPLKPLPKTNKVIGIDVGCENFLTDSNGNKIDNPRFLKKSEEILTKRQQMLSRKKKGSNRRQKAKLLLAKIHEKISNQRKDFHFKVANKLIKENDVICIEKLHNWKTFRNLNRSMRDVAWFQFFNVLRFKAEEAGKEIIEVPAENTSQICSNCGIKVQKNLSVRVHQCSCGLTIDRDINSAINILRFGLNLRSSVSSPRSPRL